VSSLLYFHNAESFMIIMRQSMRACCAHPSEKAPSGDLLPHIIERLEKLPIRPPAHQGQIELISLGANILETMPLLVLLQ
jgi:hypothetical protein